jgi:hypothetical protein
MDSVMGNQRCRSTRWPARAWLQVVDDHGLQERQLAGEEQLSAGFGAVIAAAAIKVATWRTAATLVAC